MRVTCSFEEGENHLRHQLARDDEIRYGNAKALVVHRGGNGSSRQIGQSTIANVRPASLTANHLECNCQIEPPRSFGYGLHRDAEEALSSSSELVGTSCQQIETASASEATKGDEEDAQ